MCIGCQKNTGKKLVADADRWNYGRQKRINAAKAEVVQAAVAWRGERTGDNILRLCLAVDALAELSKRVERAVRG